MTTEKNISTVKVAGKTSKMEVSFIYLTAEETAAQELADPELAAFRRKWSALADAGEV